MSEAPWLTVVVPVYNGELYLDAALGSVAAEADRGVEVLVSDDGSTDRSREIADRYSRLGRVRVLDGPARRNWVANSNAAVALAAAPLVTFLHQDDLWLPGRVRSIRGMIGAHPRHELWIAPTRFIGPDGRTVGEWRLPFRASCRSVEPAALLERLLVQNFLGMPAPVFSRLSFDRVGGMDENLWFTADWDLWIKLGAGCGAGVSQTATTAFRVHPDSQTMLGAASPAEMHRQIDVVRARHLPLILDGSTRRAVERAGRLSAELNAVLAAHVAGRPPGHGRLLRALVEAGPGGAFRVWRDARILERTLARVRARAHRGRT